MCACMPSFGWFILALMGNLRPKQISTRCMMSIIFILCRLKLKTCVKLAAFCLALPFLSVIRCLLFRIPCCLSEPSGSFTKSCCAPLHIFIDSSGENTKCVSHTFPVSCAGSDAGHLDNRINCHQGGDTFDTKFCHSHCLPGTMQIQNQAGVPN